MTSTTVKKLGLLTCSAVVAGNMMGSGIALLPASLAAIGSISVISWALAIVGAISLAYIFAKLGTINPQEGGPIAYSEEVAPILGFQAGTLYFHANWIGNLAIAITGVTYLSVFFPALTESIPAGIATIAIVWFFAFLNLGGAHWIGKLTAIGVALLLIPVIFTGVVGFFYFEPATFTANWNVSSGGDYHAVFAGVLLCLWSFIGVESATTDASLVRDPRKTIPRATMIGAGLAALVYFASCTAISGMFPAKEMAASGAPFSMAVGHMLGSWSGLVVSAVVAFGCLTSLGSWMMLVAQAGARNAHDGMLPPIFGKISKDNVPRAGILINATMMTVLMIVLMVFSGHASAQTLFGNIISIAVLLTIIPYFYSGLNLLHRSKQGKERVLCQIFACYAGLAFCLIAIAGAEDSVLVSSIVVSFIALALYSRKDRTSFEKMVYDAKLKSGS
jgi:cadaverine:lysine antiporter